jgi:hypothetical protein
MLRMAHLSQSSGHDTPPEKLHSLREFCCFASVIFSERTHRSSLSWSRQSALGSLSAVPFGVDQWETRKKRRPRRAKAARCHGGSRSLRPVPRRYTSHCEPTRCRPPLHVVGRYCRPSRSWLAESSPFCGQTITGDKLHSFALGYKKKTPFQRLKEAQVRRASLLCQMCPPNDAPDLEHSVPEYARAIKLRCLLRRRRRRSRPSSRLRW